MIEIDRLRELIKWNRHAEGQGANPKLNKMFTDTAAALEELLILQTASTHVCDVAKHECRATSVPALQGNVCLFHIEWLGRYEPPAADYRFGKFQLEIKVPIADEQPTGSEPVQKSD